MLNGHAAAVLLLTGLVFWMYTRPSIRMEMVSLLLLAGLLCLFYVFPFRSAAGALTESQVLQVFGHPALVSICSLMILGSGLTATGALEPLVRQLGRLWAFNRWLGSLCMLVLAAVASGFINDTPVLVLMLPMLLSLAERTGQPASQSLMPVNFAILAGGMLTTIGTSTNVLVLSIASDLGMQSPGIFYFTPISATAVAIAILYLWIVAPWLLPSGHEPRPELTRQYDARIEIQPTHDRLFGRTLNSIRAILGRDLPIMSVLRDGIPSDAATLGPLRAQDVLVVRDTAQGLRDISMALQIPMLESRGAEETADTRRDVSTLIAEVVVGAGSELVGKTIGAERFADRHSLAVIGLHRGTESLLRDGKPLAQVPIAAGDILLVRGPASSLSALKSTPALLVLDGSRPLPHSPLGRWAILIMLCVIAAASVKLVPLHVAAFLGVIAMLAARCIRIDSLGRALSPAVVLLIASSLALGQSLVSTGAAEWLANGIARAIATVPAAWQVGIFMALSALLTNFVSNSAAAAVGTPIAFATAAQLGAPAEPFVLAILFGANLSFATPMAYQTNLLVMKAADYSFRDFVKVGLPLVLLMLATLSLLLVDRYEL